MKDFDKLVEEVVKKETDKVEKKAIGYATRAIACRDLVYYLDLDDGIDNESLIGYLGKTIRQSMQKAREAGIKEVLDIIKYSKEMDLYIVSPFKLADIQAKLKSLGGKK
jgi:hypothetical protein